MLNKGYLTAKTNRESDEVYTPDYAVYPILKYIKKESKSNTNIILHFSSTPNSITIGFYFF